MLGSKKGLMKIASTIILVAFIYSSFNQVLSESMSLKKALVLEKTAERAIYFSKLIDLSLTQLINEEFNETQLIERINETVKYISSKSSIPVEFKLLNSYGLNDVEVIVLLIKFRVDGLSFYSFRMLRFSRNESCIEKVHLDHIDPVLSP